ncbi:adenine deaminase, partial [Staphylococcus pseudintermedius]
ECFDLKTLGAIAPGYQADFFLTDDLTKLPIHEVFYKGTLVVQSGQLQDHLFADHSNSYTCCLPKLNAQPLNPHSLELLLSSSQAHVIEIIPNSLV